MLSNGWRGPVAAAVAAVVGAVGEHVIVQGWHPDWQTEHLGGGGAAGVQPQGSCLRWPTGSAGGLTGQPA